MANAFITATYIQNAIGADEYNGFIDSTTAVGTQIIQGASSKVRSALENSGYSIPGDASAPVIVQEATLGLAIEALYARKGIEPPERFNSTIGIANDIWSGRIPVGELTIDPESAVGGQQFTNSSATATTGKPQIFKDLRKLY